MNAFPVNDTFSEPALACVCRYLGFQLHFNKQPGWLMLAGHIVEELFTADRVNAEVIEEYRRLLQVKAA